MSPKNPSSSHGLCPGRRILQNKQGMLLGELSRSSCLAARPCNPGGGVQWAQDSDSLSLQVPNTVLICMVILLNIGLAILFVHLLT